MLLKNLIQSKDAKVAVIGLGYVGLPLACAIAEAGYKVTGYDINTSRVQALNEYKSPIYAVSNDLLKTLSQNGSLRFSDDSAVLKEADIIEICVPTPLDKYRAPDLEPVINTARTISKNMRQGQLVILESTTYPGTTREVMIPILEESGLKYGKDFTVGYSPEREDPGNKSFGIKEIPKIVGADDPDTQENLVNYYSHFVKTVVPVSSLDTAEAVKLTENIFRSVNIALVNELKVIYDAMGVDIWEVIEGAKTKPFGYMPFYPGPGLGGHCIPIDPFYLSYRARAFGMSTKFIELAGEINTNMPNYVISKAEQAIDETLKKSLSDARILLLGMAYKKNVNDIRQSPALDIMHRLVQRKVSPDYYDPHIPVLEHLEEHEYLEGQKSITIDRKKLAEYDAVILLTDHDDVDYDLVANTVPLIIDTRNTYKSERADGSAHIVKA